MSNEAPETSSVGFGDWLRRELEERALTQQEFAKSIGRSRLTVSAWIRGLSTPRGINRSAIARALNLERSIVDDRIAQVMS